MSLQRGGEYETVDMQVGATANGNGTAATPFSVTRGSYNLLTAQVTGISGDTITWEGTIDETNWAAIPAYRLSNQSISTTATANGIYRLAVTGLRGVRARVSAWVAGTIYVKGILSAVGELGATGGGGGVTDHALLSNLDYASSGHTGFEAEGAANAAISTHVGLSDPHTQYALESSLGTAALLSVGTSANNIVQLDGTGKLPAVDGSQLTNLPAGSPGGSTTQVQYNNAGALAGDAGMTYNAATDRLTIAGGIVAPSIRPASDSTTALQLQNAAGTESIITVNTSGESVTIGNAANAVNRTLTLNGRMVIVKPTGVSQANLDISGGSNPFMQFGNGVAIGKMQVIDTLNWFYVGTQTNHEMRFITNNTGRGILTGAGLWALGHLNNPTAIVDLPASTVTNASLRIRSGTLPTAPSDGDIAHGAAGFSLYNVDSGTNAIINHVIANRQSSGTPAAGFGSAFAAQLESSTTNDRDAGRLSWEWVTATDASRASRGKLSAYYTTTEQEAIRWDGDTGGVKLGFYGANAVARQVLATGAGRTVDDVITALQNLGLVKQS